MITNNSTIVVLLGIILFSLIGFIFITSSGDEFRSGPEIASDCAIYQKHNSNTYTCEFWWNSIYGVLITVIIVLVLAAISVVTIIKVKKNKKYILFTIIGITLLIFGMTFFIGGAHDAVKAIDLNKLPHLEACTKLSGAQAWNEVENSCLLYGDNAALCNNLGGKMKVERECTSDECWIECQFDK